MIKQRPHLPSQLPLQPQLQKEKREGFTKSKKCKLCPMKIKQEMKRSSKIWKEQDEKQMTKNE